MAEIFVLVEHRRGSIRDVTFEMLSKAGELAEKNGSELVAVLLGHNVGKLADEVKGRANRVILVDDARLENFESGTYQAVLSYLIRERKPLLTLMGHTSFGMDVAPSLAVELNLPLVTDCIDLSFENNRLKVVRQIYGGKVNARVSCAEAQSYLATVRSAVFPVVERAPLGGEVIPIDSPLKAAAERKKFVEYVEAAAGAVDITQADIIVSVGRGIKEDKNIPVVEDLAKAMGGVLACSRPIIDKKWLPKERQVGTSGKTVKPKLYLAVGISGAFQHVAGIKGGGLLVAVNKDAKAPIFGVADYGVVNDLFKVVPLLADKVRKRKATA